MNLTSKLFTVVFLSFFMSTGCVPAETHDSHAMHGSPAGNLPEDVNLSPEIKALLTQEMRELQKAMKEIVPALVAAQWQTITDIGTRMHDSYIMKKSLTPEQMHELHESLPAGFQQLDHAFHHSAGLMAEAAAMKDREKVTHYYFRLTEACIECHTKYATDKFPEFSRSSTHNEH